MEISTDLVMKQGRTLCEHAEWLRLTWESINTRLQNDEKIVVVSAYRIYPWYSFIVEDKDGFYAVTSGNDCKGVYAAGPDLLKHQQPFVPYDGP